MKITLAKGDFGSSYRLVADDGRDALVQSDWDYPGTARTFGWTACGCGATDGTVGCLHKTATEMIAAARTYLDDHIGASVEDPGYFN